MVEIRTVKLVEHTDIKYVANDGKEFSGENAKSECLTYERQKNREEVKARFQRLNAEQIYIPIVDWFNGDAEIWKITLESKNDYYAMFDYFKVEYDLYSVDVEMPKEFPYNLILTKGYEEAWEYRGDIKAELYDVLSKL